MNEEEDIRGSNLRVDNLRVGLANIINNCNLPIGVVYFILKDVLTEVYSLYSNEASREYKVFCEQSKEKIAEAEKKDGLEETI